PGYPQRRALPGGHAFSHCYALIRQDVIPSAIAGVEHMPRRAQWAKGWAVWLLCLAVLLQPAWAAPPAGRTVLVFGDSLSAGYGMAASEGWVALLGERLAARKPGWTVVNARDRKSTRLNSSHVKISYAVFCLKKK